MRVVIASENKYKIEEFRKILAPAKIELISKAEAGMPQKIEETGLSFKENAKIKATTVFSYVGLPTFADDSGLEVKALNGRPGIYSARYSEKATDQENNKKLLKEMQNISDRRARFVCAICYINSKGDIFTIEETVEGEISTHLKGKNGFGYDPLFLYEGTSFGELSSDIKNKISHRAKAAKKLALKIKSWSTI